MDKITANIIEVLQENRLLDNEVNESNYREEIAAIAENIDSIYYISILISLEEKYQVELPDEFLSENVFVNVDILTSTINKLIESKNSSNEMSEEMMESIL